MPQDEPIATPPANVAFRISSISMPWPSIELKINEARQLPVNERRVFAII